MIPVTADKLEKQIAEYQKAGIPDGELQDLRDRLEEIKYGKLSKQTKAEPMYKKFTSDGRKVVSLSTAPMSSDDDDFEGVAFKSVRPPSSNLPKSQSSNLFLRIIQNFIDRLSWKGK